MNNKGFSLIELLGVIILITLVCSFAFPSLINFIKDSNDNQDELTNKLIFNQVDEFISDNPKEFLSISGNIYCIPIQTLIENNYLSGTFELSGEDITYTKSIKATYINEFSYEIVDRNDCVENILLEDMVVE